MNCIRVEKREAQISPVQLGIPLKGQAAALVYVPPKKGVIAGWALLKSVVDVVVVGQEHLSQGWYSSFHQGLAEDTRNKTRKEIVHKGRNC